MSYLDRIPAESDNLHKQIINYIMVTRQESILVYKRGNYNRVEDFLRGSHCIGFGGHVSQNDVNLFSTRDMGITEGAVQELFEELRLSSLDKQRLLKADGLRLVGVLNDDSSLVGQRHFALLFQYEVSDDPRWNYPERGEKSITQLRWLTPGLEPIPIWQFEYWSQLCLREFFAPLVLTSPAYLIRQKHPLKPPHVLCVLGGVGSGKSEATKILCNNFGYKEINTGQIIASILGLPPVPNTSRIVFQGKAWEFIQRSNGSDQLAKAIWEQVTALNSPRILVDGIRQRKTLEKLREYAGGKRIGLVFVHTLPDLAYKFYKQREGGDLSIFDFLRVRNVPVENEVEEMIGLGDVVLYNWTGLKEYRRAVHAMAKEMLGE